MSERQSYSPSVAVEALGLPEEIIMMLVEEFISDIDTDLDELQAAIAAQTAEEVASVAHKIKGAAANLRIDTIADIARVIELEGKSGLLSQAHEHYKRLCAAVDEVKLVIFAG